MRWVLSRARYKRRSGRECVRRRLQQTDQHEDDQNYDARKRKRKECSAHTAIEDQSANGFGNVELFHWEEGLYTSR